MTKISAWVGCVVLAVLSAVVMSTSSSAEDYVPAPVTSTSVVVQSTTSSAAVDECASALRGASRAFAGAETTCVSSATTAPDQVVVQGVSRSGDLASTGVGTNVAVLAVVGIGVLLVGGVLTFFGARMMRRPSSH